MKKIVLTVLLIVFGIGAYFYFNKSTIEKDILIKELYFVGTKATVVVENIGKKTYGTVYVRLDGVDENGDYLSYFAFTVYNFRPNQSQEFSVDFNDERVKDLVIKKISDKAVKFGDEEF